MRDRHALSWADAMAIVGHQFTKAHHIDGWPDRLTPHQAAWLQRPGARADNLAQARARALAAALTEAVERGTLPAEIETRKIEARPAHERPTTMRDALGRRVFQQVPAIKARTDKIIWLRPADLVGYLQELGEEPSAHILAWASACTGFRGGSQKERVEWWVATYLRRVEEEERRGRKPIEASIWEELAAMDGKTTPGNVRKQVKARLEADGGRRTHRSNRPVAVETRLESVWR